MPTEKTAERFAVVRVPSSGPGALAGAPNDFATEAEALRRIAEIEKDHRKSHHTYLTVVAYSGQRTDALAKLGILI